MTAVLLAFTSTTVYAQNTTEQLRTITVQGAQQFDSEQTGSYQQRYSKSALGLNLEERDTPQIITNITRQQIEDENIQSLDDALHSLSGISMREVDIGSRTTYRARGFNIDNYKVDGLEFNGSSGFDGMGASLNMDLYDRVDVLRGANGLQGGTGDPSATVVLMRKRAQRDAHAQAKVEVGRWRKRRAMVDVNTPLTENKDLRARFVVSGEDSHTFRHNENPKNLNILATATYDFSPNTTATVGIEHDYRKHKGTSWGANVPLWFADGTPTNFGRDFHLVADWSHTTRRSTTIFADAEHSFANGWKTTTNYAYTRYEGVNNFGVLKPNNANGKWGFFEQDGLAYLNAIHIENEGHNHAFSVNASGPFELFNQEHELIVGLNGSQDKKTAYTFDKNNCHIDGIVPSRGCQFRLDLPTNWQTWQGNEYGDFQTFRTDARTVTHTENFGPYAAARLSLTDKAKVIVGSRYSYYKTYNHEYDIANVRGLRKGYNKQKVWTPYLGVTYDVASDHTLYASYTDIFKPQNQEDTAGNIIKPIRGQSYEGGLKSDWLAGQLSSTIAVFHAKQENVAETDGENETPTGTQAYVAKATGVKSTGIDLQLAGALSNRWNVYAGYTYLNVVDPNANGNPRQDPRHSVRLSTTYKPNALQDKLTLGTTLSYQSATLHTPTPPGRPLGDGNYDTTPIRLAGYALANVMARYDINKQLSVSAHINNLFDKTYHRQYGFYTGQIFGEPRTYMLSARIKF